MMVKVAAAGAVAVLLLAVIIAIKRGKTIKPAAFKQKWHELQKMCANKETWPLAVLSADKLLDEALKKNRFKGKSMGERMVAAQRQLSDNDSVWFAHNLAKKIAAESVKRLRETDVKRSLVGVRQALRDLGALDGQ